MQRCPRCGYAPREGFGALLGKARERHGLTQQALADRISAEVRALGTPAAVQKLISRVERGRAVYPERARELGEAFVRILGDRALLDVPAAEENAGYFAPGATNGASEANADPVAGLQAHYGWSERELTEAVSVDLGGKPETWRWAMRNPGGTQARLLDWARRRLSEARKAQG